MKKIIILFLMCLICILPVGGYANESNNIKILCCGSYLEPDVKPFYADSRIMVPVRAVFEALGAEVSWNEETGQAIGKRDGTEVILTLGSNIITVNGVHRAMDTVLTERDNRVFAPVRFVAESFGYKVGFHSATETAVISAGTEYEFYPVIEAPLPTFDSVTGAGFIKSLKNENGLDTYYYSYDEAYVTEYINTIGVDFGYEAEYSSYDNGEFVFRCISPLGHVVAVIDYFYDNGILCIKVVPDWTGKFTPDNGNYISDTGSSYNGITNPDNPQAQLPESTDPGVPGNGNQSGVPDYSEITGSKFIDTYESGGTVIYRYEYNQFAHMNYETALMSAGWRFYDFDFDIDSFTNTTYYTNGHSIMSVALSYGYGEVWIVYP